jgi:type I restriction enzyme S subunit
MSEACLPPQWAEATLDEIAEIQGGIQKGKKRSSSLPLRDVPYLRVANVQRGYLDLDVVQSIQATEEEISQLCLQVGDVLFNEGGDRDKLGRGWIWTGALSECIHQNHVFRARIIDRILNPKLLSWYGNTLGQQYFFDEGKQTTNLASLNSSKLKALPVLVPPQAEQHRIVEAIESYLTRLDDAMATLERVQRNLERYRASVLKAAVEGRLVPTEAELARAESREYEPASVLLERILVERRRRWEEAELAKTKGKGRMPKSDTWKANYVEPAAPDTSELPELPEGWCWATIEQLESGDRKTGYGVLVPGEHTSLGVPLVRVGDINKGRIDGTSLKCIDRAIADKFAKTYLQGGEVLLTLVGSIGRTGLVPTSLSGANVARAVGVIPQSSLLVPHWLEFWLRSPSMRHFMISKAHEVARKTLNLEDVRPAHVALPPLCEQSRICEAVEYSETSIDSLESSSKLSYLRSTKLRQSILKWAFEGRLVDQDPSEEPAAELLERIRVERAAANGKQQPRTRRVNTKSVST